jgi:acetyl-CoA carboxylase carboxyl transferase subunit alpha
MATNKEDYFIPEFERPIFELQNRIDKLKESSGSESESVPNTAEITKLEQDLVSLKKQVYGGLTPYQRIQIARHPKRPYSLDYINTLFTDFVELHGDRGFSDDKAVVAGTAVFDKNPVVIIGQQKGRSVTENLMRNFGMMHPEGYRKALRIMKLAEKFKKPLIVFIDTPGAYPGIGAEERGQGEAIARNLKEMANLNTPIICIVVGEGCSGGALGIGVGDRIVMLENSYYSVISPEGYSAILWNDSSRAEEAATVAKITANDLYQFGVADEVIPEPPGGCHKDVPLIIESVRQSIRKHLAQLIKLPVNKLLDLRYKKYRKMGGFFEPTVKISRN